MHKVTSSFTWTSHLFLFHCSRSKNKNNRQNFFFCHSPSRSHCTNKTFLFAHCLSPILVFASMKKAKFWDAFIHFIHQTFLSFIACSSVISHGCRGRRFTSNDSTTIRSTATVDITTTTATGLYSSKLASRTSELARSLSFTANLSHRSWYRCSTLAAATANSRYLRGTSSAGDCRALRPMGKGGSECSSSTNSVDVNQRFASQCGPCSKSYDFVMIFLR